VGSRDRSDLVLLSEPRGSGIVTGRDRRVTYRIPPDPFTPFVGGETTRIGSVALVATPPHGLDLSRTITSVSQEADAGSDATGVAPEVDDDVPVA
jgi:hypothetical protein